MFIHSTHCYQPNETHCSCSKKSFRVITPSTQFSIFTTVKCRNPSARNSSKIRGTDVSCARTKNNFNFSKKMNKFRSYRPTHPYQHNRVRRRIHEIRTIHSVIQFFVFNFYFLLLRRRKND